MSINPFESNVDWAVFNPTPKKISTQFNGYDIEIEPFTDFKTPHKVVRDHLFNNVNNRNFGLVDYTYTNEMKSAYPTEKEFQKSKIIEGLRNYEAFLEETLHYERVAVQQNKIQKVPSFLKSKEKDFDGDLKKIQSLIGKYLEEPNESGPNKNSSKKKT